MPQSRTSDATSRTDRTLVVTGGAGFIGSNLVHYALAHTTHRLVIVDKLTYAGSLLNLEGALTDPRVTFVEADIADGAAMTRLFAESRPDAVLNLAAETHVDRSIDSPRPFIDTNILGTFVLLETARQYVAGLPADRSNAFRFLHVSTDEVYGTLGESGQFSEDTPYAPNSPYAASKASADHLVRAYFHTYHLPVLLTNCSNNYGPRQFPEKLIPLMALNAIDGRPLPIYGNGGNVRDWLHVDDHCSGLLLGTGQRPCRREVQYRRRQRANEPPGRGRPLRRARPAASQGRRLPRAQDVRAGSARPRLAIRDRRVQDSPRARVGAPPYVRRGTARNRPLVSRTSRLVRSRAGRAVRSPASRPEQVTC